MRRRRQPRGYPRHNLPACAFWTVPDEIPMRFYGSRLWAWQRPRFTMSGWGDRPMDTGHDHDTGAVRGLLCTACNTEESNSDHPAFVAYRNGVNPAAIIGHVEQYRSAWTG